MNFNSIWLKNRLYNSQIELFSFDLAIEYLVDTLYFILSPAPIRDKFRTSLYLVNYPCTAKRRIKYINSLIYSMLLTRFSM